MTQEGLIRYNCFLLTQLDLMRLREIRTLYRGDSLKNLCEKLNVEYNNGNPNVKDIIDRLFMVGEKAVRYYTDNENFRIEDVDEYVFNKIMEYFKSSLKAKNTNTIYFFERNKTLNEFFSDKNNKEIFLEIIRNADRNERMFIRNYYLTLLHQLAAINYKRKSHFVSTSKDYKIAEKFANYNSDGHTIILHCWQPIKKERQTIKKYNLPSYSFGPYDYQKEFSVLGGILPHYISGLEIKASNDFYPNPNIFRQEITNETFLNGLEIDQRNFQNIIRMTNYKTALETDGADIWEINTSP